VTALEERLGSDKASRVLAILAQLPVEPNQFSDEAAFALADNDEELIFSLVGYSLIQPVGERYSLRRVVADYSLQQHQPDSVSAGKIVSYFSPFAIEHASSYRTLDLETANLDAALTLAATHNLDSSLIDTVIALYPFWQSRGLMDQAKRHFDAAEARLENAAPTQRAELYTNRVRLALTLGDIEEAESYVSKGISVLETLPDSILKAHLLTLQAQIAHMQGETVEARTLCKTALGIAEQKQDAERISVISKNLGLLDDEAGEAESARHFYRRALETAKKLVLRALRATFTSTSVHSKSIRVISL
jgi:tetratricopeptide (TPR) repeat protein